MSLSTSRAKLACPGGGVWLRALAAAAVTAAALATGGCEGEQHARDASVAPTLQTGEISIRFDVSPQGAAKPPMISVLAFHAMASGVAPRDVLGVVDPLAASAPEHDCELRDLDLSAGALAAQGGSIELQELTGIGLALGDSRHSSSGGPEGFDLPPSTIVRPFPRLFPDVATVVGGVVAESGPLPLATLPERVGLLTPASELPIVELAVPVAPRILAVNGAPLAGGAKLETRDGLALVVGVSGGAATIIELRPFGATAAISCAVQAGAGGDSTLVVPAALLARLLVAVNPSLAANGGNGVAASLDVLSRARVQVAPFAVSNHLSIEVRASMAVELRP
ncbi:MAG TPA: hypothetical protein VFH68_18175 [Polyangia bacterium]|nr:hypothetical protein [Polyangia bacterium]